MNHAARPSTRDRLALGGTALMLAATIAACGSSAPASTVPSAAPIVAAPSVVTPSVEASVPVTPSTAPTTATGSNTPGVDAAAGLKIDPPYTLAPMPGALQQLLETQMAASLSGAGGQLQVGFRQVGGGTGTPILMVMGFPTGSLNDAAYQVALNGMTTSMGAAFTTTTVDGVEVSTGTAATGGLSVFHIGDHMLVVIGSSPSDGPAMAKALISANQ